MWRNRGPVENEYSNESVIIEREWCVLREASWRLLFLRRSTGRASPTTSSLFFVVVYPACSSPLLNEPYLVCRMFKSWPLLSFFFLTSVQIGVLLSLSGGRKNTARPLAIFAWINLILSRTRLRNFFSWEKNAPFRVLRIPLVSWIVNWWVLLQRSIKSYLTHFQ